MPSIKLFTTLSSEELHSIKSLNSFTAAMVEYNGDYDFSHSTLKDLVKLLLADIVSLGHAVDIFDVKAFIEDNWAATESEMLFDIIEVDQTGESISEQRWFTVNNDMIENSEYPIVEDWLESEDLNSFSTSYLARPSQQFEFCFVHNISAPAVIIGIVVGYIPGDAYDTLNSDIPFSEVSIYSKGV